MKEIISQYIKIKINPNLSLMEIFEVAEKKLLEQNKKPIRIILINLGKNFANFLVSCIYDRKSEKK